MVLLSLRCTLFPGIFDCEGNGDGNSGNNRKPITPTPPPNAIKIYLASSNTKENWINKVVEQFNQEQHTITSGAPIFVRRPTSFLAAHKETY